MFWKQFLTPVKNIDAKEAQTFIDEHLEGTYTLLDVRQPAEYEKSRIPGSKLIPVGELADRLGELDREKPIVAY
jgi:sulfur-carrier protein adenylyltransferase/sulfurtransferase